MEWAGARQTQPAQQSRVTQSEELAVAADHTVWKTAEWTEESLSPCHNTVDMQAEALQDVSLFK